MVQTRKEIIESQQRHENSHKWVYTRRCYRCGELFKIENRLIRPAGRPICPACFKPNSRRFPSNHSLNRQE